LDSYETPRFKESEAYFSAHKLMDQETNNNLEGFENASEPSTTSSPTLHNLVKLMATQNDVLCQLLQGQQTIQQLLQQQQHQLREYPIY